MWVKPRRSRRHRALNTPVSTQNLANDKDVAAPAKSAVALDSQELHLLDAYWRAANYLSVGQIYLYDNPMLREKLTLEHVKPLVVGHWGTTPGQNFILSLIHISEPTRRTPISYAVF